MCGTRARAYIYPGLNLGVWCVCVCVCVRECGCVYMSECVIVGYWSYLLLSGGFGFGVCLLLRSLLLDGLLVDVL